VVGNGRRAGPSQAWAKVARFLLGLQQRYEATQLAAVATVMLVNGDLGLLFPASPGDGAHPPLGRRVCFLAVRDGRIAVVYDVVNPDKLTRLPG
jgi:RNA polymerase sigma-70 factor (ECF subfamily)